MFDNKKILITGGTGSWGQELTKKLLNLNPQEIRIFSRNEFAQVNMKSNFNNERCLKFFIGDIRDYQSVFDACQGVDIVFHLAALKHVPICEAQPLEALKTNVLGTENIIRASIVQGVKKVIDVSTDKAVNPINFYGLTKAIGEKMMIHANNLSETTSFVCIRGGNVLGTNGSVVPLFKKLILDNRDITITHPDMTRFFLTKPQAIELLLKASEAAVGGETFVMKMRSCRIVDLAKVLIKKMSTQKINIKNIGIRPGEKLHENLVSSYESPYTLIFDDNYYVILPTHPSPKLFNYYKHLPKVSFEKYDSNTNLMTTQEIEKLLIEGGFLNEPNLNI